MNEHPDPQQGPDEAAPPAPDVEGAGLPHETVAPAFAWPPVSPDGPPTQQHPLTQPVPYVQPPAQPPYPAPPPYPGQPHVAGAELYPAPGQPVPAPGTWGAVPTPGWGPTGPAPAAAPGGWGAGSGGGLPPTTWPPS